ncbi:hypothetical protein ACFL6E_01350 [Candidatus Neomarinimicrobiota bacterium]
MMLLIYLFSAICIIGLVLVGLGGLRLVGFMGMNHAIFAFMVSALFFFTETVVIFYFIGMGSNVKTYIQDNPGTDPEYRTKSNQIKREVYPITLWLILAVMVTFIIGGGVEHGIISRWFHLAGWLAIVILFIKAIKAQHKAMRDQTILIWEIMGIDTESMLSQNSPNEKD